jgi:hypothetical protein
MPSKPTAVKKVPKEKKAKVVKELKEGEVVAARPRLPKFPDEHLITVLTPDSKARGAAERFKLYFTGQTVKEYADTIIEVFQRTSGQIQADLRWDVDHGFVHIGPEVVPIPPPPVTAAAPEAPPAP